MRKINWEYVASRFGFLFVASFVLALLFWLARVVVVWLVFR